MRHGDEVRILVDGPFLRLKSLEPIGISHHSQCWGVWIEKRLRQGESYNPNEALDLVISPIHPSLWPFAFRIEAALHTVNGTLKSLADQLSNNKVNILFLDQSPAGYTHSIFNAICAFDLDHEMLKEFEQMENDVYKVRRKAQVAEFERSVNIHSNDETPVASSLTSVQADINENRTKCFQTLGRLMIARLAGLWASLRNAEQAQYEKRGSPGEDIFFLAPRVIEQGLEPWFLRILDPDGQLLKIDPVANNSNDATKKQLTEEIESFIDKSGALMKDILDTAFPVSGERLRDILLKMKDSHAKTRYSVSASNQKDGDLTTQAMLAHLEDEVWMRHVIRRIAWRHAHLPLSVQALSRLAEMRCWMSPHDPIEFSYDAENCLLRPASTARFTAQVNELGRSGSVDIDKPVWALAAYHPEDRFVRLRFLPGDTEKNRVRIEVEYQIPGQPAPDLHFAGLIHRRARSKGLLASLACAIFVRKGNIMRVTNSLATFDPNTGLEVGKLRFVVQFESEEWTVHRIEELRDVIRDAVNNVINEQSCSRDIVRPRATCQVHVVPFQRERIFVSTVYSHGRSKDFRRILDDVATRHGLETRYAEQYTQSIRHNVHQEISECMYFLQIITPHSEDRVRMQSDPTFVPDFSWITYEHGCAVALQRANPTRRCIQMVDELLSEVAAKRVQHTQGDVAPIVFRIDDDDKTLHKHFSAAVRALTGDR
jgi:hypothetical protein